MSWWELLAVFGAGIGAGLINTVVGSGTLITFPTLLAIGIPPVIANVSNTVGLAPGGVSAVLSMRSELAGQRSLLIRLGAASLVGGHHRRGAAADPAVGGVRRHRAGADRSRAVCWSSLSRSCRSDSSSGAPTRRPKTGLSIGRSALWIAVLVTGVYGGYFGAAQGVLLLAILGIALTQSLVRVNAVKNVLALIVNAISGVIFIVISQVELVGRRRHRPRARSSAPRSAAGSAASSRRWSTG